MPAALAAKSHRAISTGAMATVVTPAMVMLGKMLYQRLFHNLWMSSASSPTNRGANRVSTAVLRLAPAEPWL